MEGLKISKSCPQLLLFFVNKASIAFFLFIFFISLSHAAAMTVFLVKPSKTQEGINEVTREFYLQNDVLIISTCSLAFQNSHLVQPNFPDEKKPISVYKHAIILFAD